MKKLVSLFLAFCMVFALAACGGGTTGTNPGTSGENDATAEPNTPKLKLAELKSLANKVYGEDYTAMYEHLGKDVTIDQVVEDPETGFACLEIDGEYHILGMDFLSYAMVYNTSVPEGGRWKTEADVFATWWKYFMVRWNDLMPELPIYNNDFLCLYNTQIKGVAEHPVTASWNVTHALLDWTSEKEDNSITIGMSTELSGSFRYPSFGRSTPGASDLDVFNLVTGLETVSVDREGNYVWNDTVVQDHSYVDNADGTRTYTIKLHEDLKFSDGSAVTAKNYLVESVAFSTEFLEDYRAQAGVLFVGFEEFHGGAKEFTGLRLLDEYTFSVTLKAEYANYYHNLLYMAFAPVPLGLWLGDNDLVDDGNGVYLTEGFYSKDMVKHIEKSSMDISSYPYSGPYMVKSFDKGSLTAVLVRNPHFKGTIEGTVPSIEKVTYISTYTDSGTELDLLRDGKLDVVSGVTGEENVTEAIALADGSKGSIGYAIYPRAGYVLLTYRADFSPVQFAEVRQAIAHAVDRNALAAELYGEHCTVANGPYDTNSSLYQKAVAEGMELTTYEPSVEQAIALLEAGGWVYNAEGGEYTEGVRYKKIPASEMLDDDITFASVDGVYKTVQVGEDYYMPLVLNLYAHEVSQDWATMLVAEEALAAAGFEVQYTAGAFNDMYDEWMQGGWGGSYSGTPTYNCFQTSCGFGGAFDQSSNWTIDPELYEVGYNANYIKDPADAYWLK